MGLRDKSLPIFRDFDHKLRSLIQGYPAEISCDAGCNYCCYRLNIIFDVEANILAEAIMDEGFPPPILQRLEAAAEKAREVNGDQKRFWMAQVPCPLLLTGRCWYYAFRPLPCRAKLVTSPPADCASISEDAQVEELDVPQDLVRDAFLELQGEVTATFGPLPVMVLQAVKNLLKKGKEAAK